MPPSEERERHLKVYLMKTCYLFDTVVGHEIMLLISAMKFFGLKAGTEIYAIGDEADGMYWVVKGKVKIKAVEEGSPPVKALGRGKFFGELGLILSARRTETVVAETDCELASLLAEDFERVHGKFRLIMLRQPEVYKEFCMKHFKTEEPGLFEFR